MNDYDSHNNIHAVTYVCKHNKTYEKPIPQIISDNQQRSNCQTMDIDRHRLWTNNGGNNTIDGELKDQRIITPVNETINDSGIETT